eukprot:GILK01003431.1.p1 GENE.GILK01003431.1~~GILK01003431.1.p1  ORF type:complete len:555 (+),score=104.65 GILK01003431.1:63-1727(+)
MWKQALLAGDQRHPLTPGVKYTYGTAGFRTKANILDGAMYRVGIVATLRSLLLGKTIGVMVTASHNPVQDNGVKIVDPDGEMLATEWEAYAVAIANAPNIVEAVEELARRVGLDVPTLRHGASTFCGRVVVGKDTRPSSEALTEAVKEAVVALGAEVIDCGLQTTPQLHFVVRTTNNPRPDLEATERQYYVCVSEGYKRLVHGLHATEPRSLILDCADGVGGQKAKLLAEYLGGYLHLDIKNDGTSADADLNEGVGAEFVQKEKKIPRQISLDNGHKNKRCASVDGDADRVVYFYLGEQGELCLQDGDKITTLIAVVLKKLIDEAGINGQLRIGAVQTAYANGASTAYIRDVLGLEVACEPTGVKHLHHRAAEFDIGIYFEANGHGTVLIAPSALSRLEVTLNQVRADPTAAPEKKQALERLLAFFQVSNQAVGDALADMLLVEGALAILDWSVQKWDQIYSDLPSRMLKVVVPDRTVIHTTHDETQVTKPAGLQAAIEGIVTNYKLGRSFVRPSGTEDVVRVYAEADTQAAADELAETVSSLVSNVLSKSHTI